MKPRIVLSGVNFTEAGPLAIFQDALRAVVRFADRYEIHALVHRRDLFDTANVTYHEYAAVKQGWWRRLRFEYWESRAISKELRPYLWLSMHDMTPPVQAEVQAVYCHNPVPFYSLGVREAFFSYKFTLFTLFYRYLYRIFIQRNRYVIVQQQWLREAFQRLYGLNCVIVAHPSVQHLGLAVGTRQERGRGEPFRFIYPAFSRSFKNIELALAAMEILEGTGVCRCELQLTISGSEDGYARMLRARYGGLKSVSWMGALPRTTVMRHYAQVDCLLFTSRLETWGMPLTEFKETGKPILVVDLPYAHEAIGTYTAVHFISPDDAAALATAMQSICEGTLVMEGSTAAPISPPFAANWTQLFELLLSENS